MARQVGLRKIVQNLLPDSENEDFVPSDEDVNNPPINIRSKRLPYYSSDEDSDDEGGLHSAAAHLLLESGSKVPVKILGESNFTPESFVSLIMDDTDAEDINDDEEMEVTYSNPIHQNNSTMILGTMYNEEVVENNSSIVTEIEEHSCQSDQELELNQGDDVIMEENVNNIADKHREKRLKLDQQPQSGTGSSRDKETPGSTGTPRGNVTPRGKGTPRVTGTPRSTGSRRGKRTSRAPRFKRRLSFTELQWKRGDKLTELYVTDDDVPDELRETITQIAQSRENSRLQRVKKNRTSEGEDGIEDDGEDELLFAGAANTTRFEWSSMADYSGKREEFLPEVTGPAHAFANAYGAFRHYWDDEILAHIVKETNRYAEALCRSCPAFALEWYETNIHEILILFAFWMMLGILRMPTIKSCFSLNPMLQVNIFRHMFSKNRYVNLYRAFTLNFNDSSSRTDDSNLTHSFGPILDHLNSRFRESYIPSQNICIDESLLLWKGSLSFRQCIRTKAARFGVKTFELCESATGYLWSFFIYLGANTVYDPDFPPTLLKSTATVLTLVKPLLDKGYTLYLDNWFNSPLLAKYLKTRNTDCVGTLRANRRNVPPIIPLCNLREGQFVARHSGNVVVMAYQSKMRKVTTISTFHGTEQDCKTNIYKPQVVLDYNKGMGGVDRKDQMLEPYLLERKKCGRWNLKVFKRLLNCSILNSRILLRGTAANTKEHLVFRLDLVEQILLNHLQKVPKPKPVGATSRFKLGRDTTAEKHWPRQIETVMSKGRRSRRRCVWCTQNKTNRRTTFVCSECDVPLCVQPCFKEYHNYHSSLPPSKARLSK